MTDNPLMNGFPPAPQAQVTLANWRTAPFSAWAFRHVRELMPTAAIAARADAPAPARARGDALDVLDVGAGRSLADLLGATQSDAFCVLHRGETVFDWFRDGVDARDPHIVFSVSKSFTAVLAGLLEADGVLDPDAPVTEYVPEALGSAFGTARVRHLLDMTVSIEFDESYLAAGGPFIRYRQAMGWNPRTDPENPPDLRGFLCELEAGDGPHGDIFNYVSPNTDMLGWVIERASGKRFVDLMSTRLWQPLEMAPGAYVSVDRLGAPRSAGGLCMGVHDMARLGEVMRRGGDWQGKQVLPAAFVEDTVTGGDRQAWLKGALADFLPRGKYRNKWYQIGNDSGAFCAIGIHGQWIYVDPAREVVMARQSCQPLPLDDGADLPWLTAFDAIAAHC